MFEAVVLFVHHRNDEATRFHRDMLRSHNDFPIVPLFCNDGQGGEPLDDAVHIPMTFRRGRNWHNMDWLCCEWFRSTHRIDAERYIWLEWDCHVNAPLKSWYADHWNRDLVASTAHHISDQWYWFRTQRDFLPHTLYPFAAGVEPMNGILISRQAMEIYASEDLPEGVFCELRLATILASRGIHVSPLPPDRSRTNRFLYEGKSVEVDGKGLFHPVKFVVDN